MATIGDEEFLTVRDVARELGVKRARVAQIIKGVHQVNKETGEVIYQHPPLLPATRVGGQFLVRRSDLEKAKEEKAFGWPGRLGRNYTGVYRRKKD